MSFDGFGGFPNSPTRGILQAGSNGRWSRHTQEWIMLQFQSAGNVTDFGDLGRGIYAGHGASVMSPYFWR